MEPSPRPSPPAPSVGAGPILLLRQVPLARTGLLAREPGQGCTVLCAPQPEAVATAQRLFPDRRIEVKTVYGEPGLGRPGEVGDWALLGWMLRPRPGAEGPGAARERVVSACARLVSLAKTQGEAVLVAGPGFLRLTAFKLNAIGFAGGFITGLKPGRRRAYRFRP